MSDRRYGELLRVGERLVDPEEHLLEGGGGVAELREGLRLRDDVLALDRRFLVLVHRVVQVVAQQRRLPQPSRLLAHRLGAGGGGAALAGREGEGVGGEEHLVLGVELRARRRVVRLRVDQVDCDPEVGLRVHLVLGVRVRVRVVAELDEARDVKGDVDELGVAGKKPPPPPGGGGGPPGGMAPWKPCGMPGGSCIGGPGGRIPGSGSVPGGGTRTLR